MDEQYSVRIEMLGVDNNGRSGVTYSMCSKEQFDDIMEIISIPADEYKSNAKQFNNDGRCIHEDACFKWYENEYTGNYSDMYEECCDNCEFRDETK